MTPLVQNPPPSGPPDGGAALVELARAGDSEAFDALCREYGDRLLGQALGLCGDPAAAEDLVQETLIAAWRSLGRFNEGCRFFTWLCSILLNRHRRARRRWWARAWVGWDREPASESAEVLSIQVDPGGSPPAQAEEAERAAALRRSLECLPARQREVVYLRFYAGESLEGIAAALGCPVGTVKSRLFHGLERLRRIRALEEHRKP